MSLQSKANGIPVIILSIFLVGMLVLAGCSKDPEPTSSGGGGTSTSDVNLSTPTVSPAQVETGQTAVVEVIATDADSDPIVGLSVDFVVSPSQSGYFTPIRSSMIAVTEVTRIFSMANIDAWNRSGVVLGKKWMTARDDLVCSICAPLDGNEVGLKEFGFHVEGAALFAPPAHVNCRCWLQPVTTV